MDWMPVTALLDSLKPSNKKRLVRSAPVLVSNGVEVWAATAYKGLDVSGKEYSGWDVYGATGAEYENDFADPTRYRDLPKP